MTLGGVIMNAPKLPNKGVFKYASRVSKIDKIRQKLYNKSLHHYQVFNEIEAKLVRLDYLERVLNDRFNKANS